jgi:transposase
MIYLPPYSPDSNPIEKVFACFKMRLQHKFTLTGRESDADKIEDCLRQVATPALIRSFYCNGGYLN